MTGVLEGVRVLDFGRYIAGPYCGALLADLGADVIRIDKLAGSEDRYVGPIGDDGTGAGYVQMNRNKRGITLNPMKPEGREIVRRLVETADVVIANMPTETLVAMGLDYDTLRGYKEDIIVTNTTTFGDVGPYKNRVGFDGIAQAMCGSVYMAGTPEQPQRNISPYVDFSTAMASTIGTMAALTEKERTGKGQHVTSNLLSNALSMFNGSLIEQSVTGVNRVATGNRGQLSAPTDIYKCKDGSMLVQVVGQPLFARWAELMGEEHWLTDPRFKDDVSRGKHGNEISARMQNWCEDRTVDEAVRACESVRIPCGPVYAPQQTLDDPHIQEMNYLKEMEYPGIKGPTPVADIPVNMSVSEIGIRHRAPLLGEHTDDILSELGFSANNLASLRKKRVI
ncbi:formyl-CoA transferase [Alphaproteobacteria bacterium 46_93_T64]|nr:formyl-CoA transferase [Alphaproteobacteria bacterium 46_93_T64]